MSAATARLVRPSVAYRDGYIAAVREHQAEGRFIDARFVENDTPRLARDFASFVEDVLHREFPPPGLGRVPEAFYWLVDADDYIGQTSYREFAPNDRGLREVGHVGYDIRPSRQGRGYGTVILGAMLAECGRRGVRYAYVNCDEDNERSRRVIEHWGGEFEESIFVPGRSVRRRRYRIDLP